MVNPQQLNRTLQKSISEGYSKETKEQFERVESRFAKRELARLQSKLAHYRAQASGMNFLALSTERHSSKALGEFMRAMNMPRPGPRWEAHHIVSGKHVEATGARALLADDLLKIRIDDPDNGCWMPKTRADALPTIYPNAIGHNRIHRDRYYRWIENNLAAMPNDGLARAFLNTVRQQLLHGNIKQEFILQQEIDEAEYYSWIKKNR